MKIIILVIFPLLTSSISGCFWGDNSPSNLQAIRINETHIKLTWEDNTTKEQGFKLERKTTGEEIYKEIAVIPVNTTSFDDINVSTGKTYFYRIRAYLKNINTSYSNVAVGTTALILPEAPSDLHEDGVFMFHANLSWKDNSFCEKGYIIERKDSYGEFKEISRVNADTNVFKDRQLKANTTYFYRVYAYNEIGKSDSSSEVNITTKNNNSIPDEPTDLTAETISDSQVKLTWKDNSYNETGFNIIRKSEGGTYKEIATVDTKWIYPKWMKWGNAVTYLDVNLKYNTKYYYRVNAFNRKGNSDYSEEAFAITNDVIPQRPMELTANVNYTNITLTWKDESDNELGFKIERSLDGNIYNEIDSVGKDITTYTDTGLTPETIYYYRVRAYNSIGESNYSDSINAKALDFLPNTPSELNGGFLTENSINITWKDNADNEYGFIIERSTDGVNFNKIVQIGKNNVIYKDTDVNKANNYYYKILAYNNTGTSDYSNTFSIKYSIDMYSFSQKAQFNNELVTEVLSDVLYEDFTNVYLVRLKDDLCQNKVNQDYIHAFGIDKKRCSVFYTNGYSIKEFQDKTNLQQPISLAVTTDGIIYISDIIKESILKYHYNGFSISYDGSFYSSIKAIDLKIDNSNNLYVLDQKTNSIIKLDSNAKPINSFVTTNENIKTNIITSYIYKDQRINNDNFSEVKSIDLDGYNNIYLVEKGGLRFLKLNQEGYVEKIKYVSSSYKIDDIAVTQMAIYLISQNANSIMLIDPINLNYIGKYNPIDYGDPWWKLEKMNKIEAYPPLGIIFIIDSKGGGVFTEKPFNGLYSK